MPTLAEQAKVKVSQSTIDAYESKMPLAKRRELRREAIIAYINRKPIGTRIKLEEFKAAGNFATDANTDVFIKKMLKDGVIIRDNITPRTFCYQVAGGGRGTNHEARRSPTQEAHSFGDRTACYEVVMGKSRLL